MKTKEPIRLRQRKTSTGLISLYLDIYAKGKRSYEYLRLYLVPEKNREDKRKNNETLQLAEAIKAKRIVELRNGDYGFKTEDNNINFYSYYIGLMRTKSEHTQIIWNAVALMLQTFDERLKERTWAEIDKNYIKKFVQFLEKSDLSQNSQVIYFSKIVACCNKAVADGIIQQSPALGVEKPKKQDTERQYLTIDEVRRLAETDCKYPRLKDAFLFSCLTGLRRSDIIGIKWINVIVNDNFTRIVFNQRKTKGLEYLDITPEAAILMGERGKDSDFIFNIPKHSTIISDNIGKWCKAAGITKHITFHCARHTFATMMIELDTDLYTVSKLLGHRNIATTQIYAKIVDKKKQEAALKIPKILPKK